MSGINVINVYTFTIFDKIRKQTHINTGLSPESCTYFMGCANFIGASLGPFTLTLLKRRTQFIGGHLLLTICLVLTAVFIKIKEPTWTLVAMTCFVLVYQIFIGGAFWVYVGEIGTEA